LVTIPSVLYSGSIAVLQLFDVPSLLGITFEQAIWVVVWIIGIIGACYAIFGGLKAVAISDTLNGIGLLIVGILVPILGFIALGDGRLLNGMKIMATNAPEKLNAIGSSTDAVPVGTIFTGMIFMNLFYWGTNQYVIQRTLGAQSFPLDFFVLQTFDVVDVCQRHQLFQLHLFEYVQSLFSQCSAIHQEQDALKTACFQKPVDHTQHS